MTTMINRGDIITAEYLNDLERLSRGSIPAGYDTRAISTHGTMPGPANSFSFTPFYLDAWFNPDAKRLRICYSFGRIEFLDVSYGGSFREGFMNPEDFSGPPIGEYKNIEVAAEYVDTSGDNYGDNMGQFSFYKLPEDGGGDSSNTSWKLITVVKCAIRKAPAEFVDSKSGYTFSTPFLPISLYPTEVKVSSLQALQSSLVWGEYDLESARFIVACCEGNRRSYKDAEGFYYLAPNRKAVANGTAIQGFNFSVMRVDGHILPSPHVRITEKHIRV